MTIDIYSLVFSKLSDDSDVSSFACSDSKDLEDFLRNDADSTYAPTRIRAAKTMNPHIDRVFAGAVYDSFEIHADTWYQLDTIPFIDYRETTMFHEEGIVQHIDHRVNKLWKPGGNIHARSKRNSGFCMSMTVMNRRDVLEKCKSP